MHIVFICGAYPSNNHPHLGVFVQQFAWSMARLGHRCTVICPTSIFKKHNIGLTTTDYYETSGDGLRVHVLRPYFLSASSRKFGPFNSGRITQKLFDNCVLHTLQGLSEPADILYGVFLYNGGKAAAWCGQKMAIPAVIEVGEGTFWSIRPFGVRQARQELANATAFRALGGHLRRELMSQLQIPEAKITVIPNGVDRRLFHPGERAAARSQLGLDRDKFIVLFVGTFNQAKGGPELVAAVEEIPDCYLVMLGSGPLDFTSERILFKGTLSHEQLPLWYQAADIFALPTRIEGSCNAAIEAMCCGLPLVTSKGEHMVDIADESNALVVDETKMVEVRDAIISLKNDADLREKLAAGSRVKAGCFDIINRATEVESWFKTLIKDKKTA